VILRESVQQCLRSGGLPATIGRDEIELELALAVMLSAWALWHDLSVHHADSARVAGPTYRYLCWPAAAPRSARPPHDVTPARSFDGLRNAA
jgi:hypothetical protein